MQASDKLLSLLGPAWQPAGPASLLHRPQSNHRPAMTAVASQASLHNREPLFHSSLCVLGKRQRKVRKGEIQSGEAGSGRHTKLSASSVWLQPTAHSTMAAACTLCHFAATMEDSKTACTSPLSAGKLTLNGISFRLASVLRLPVLSCTPWLLSSRRSMPHTCHSSAASEELESSVLEHLKKSDLLFQGNKHATHLPKPV